jgi:membrane fusion protein, heavy metal efflux system
MPIKPILACFIAVIPLFSGGCKEKPHTQNLDIPVADSVKTQSRQANDTDTLNPAVPGEGTERLAECSGIIAIPASDIVVISPPESGVVKSLFYPAGAYVQSGAPLATIENINFLKMQQEYLEAKSQFSYYGEEFKRQGELTLENATSLKKMQQAQLDYQTSEIKFRSLAQQLALCGFVTDSIDVDHFSPLMTIRAPVSGFIDKITIHPGNHISSGEKLIVMVRNYNTVLQLDIPEKYFRDIKKGQSVEFFLPGDSGITHKACLSFISNQAETGKHMIRARAIPADPALKLIPGTEVRVRLILAGPGC